MSARRKRQSDQSASERFGQADLLRLACLTGTGTLLVATPLVPSEAAAEAGVANVLASGWLVVASGWLAMFTLNPASRLRTSPAMLAVLAFGLWQIVDMALQFRSIHPRPAVNMALVYVGAGACVFSLVQLLRSAAERNGVLVLMIVLAAGLSTHGLYQYFVSMPKDAREYDESGEQQKQRLLQSLNLDPNPGSADRSHFEDRLKSTEPFATFGLGNSLAGFLAPLLVLIVAAIGTEAMGRRQWSVLAALAAFLVVCAVCVMLSKSRTAYLAILAGIGLLMFLGRVKRINRRWVAVGAAATLALVALVGLGVLVGGVDVKVLSEAAKSFSYRIEFWQATMSMIGDSPLLGCGPGQFQSAYTQFKLPQASETVADPHNFLLEVAATAGIPGLLLLLAAVGLHLRTERGGVESAAHNEPRSQSLAESPSSRWAMVAMAIGAGPGAVLAMGVGAMVDHVPDVWGVACVLVAVVVGFPLWWFGATAPKSAVIAALLTWCVNLLAAGGFGFPGVAMVGWVLFSLLIVQAPTRAWGPGQGVRLALLVSVAAMVLAAMQYGTRPLQARLALSSPLISNTFSDARRLGLEAAERDPLWAEPWSHLAAVYHHRWLQSGSAADRKLYKHAESKLLKLDPRSWTRRRQVADWRLSAWRARGDSADLSEALAALNQAVDRFPNSIGLHAQLAWCLNLSGDRAQASREAEVAMLLDSQHPHRENKLAKLHIYDPGPSRLVERQLPAPPDSAAEPIMRLLRTAVEQ